MSDVWILEERDSGWVKGILAAAERNGHTPRRITDGSQVKGPGIGFIRPHANPEILKKNIAHDDPLMREQCLMIQDRQQVEVYEDKFEQFRRWGDWMPYTEYHNDKEAALDAVSKFFSPDTSGKMVSKAAVGASSRNVWILDSVKEARKHINQLWGEGIRVNHCAGGGGSGPAWSVQKGEILMQEFVPQNKFTWRVNRVGDLWAIFQRHNYPDRPVAQTGNTQPVKKLDRHMEHLLDFAYEVTQDIQSKWVALDILWYPDFHIKKKGEWQLLETSLAYPWPSPGDCDNNVFWSMNFEDTGRKWVDMFDVMFEQVEAGVWDA